MFIIAIFLLEHKNIWVIYLFIHYLGACSQIPVEDPQKPDHDLSSFDKNIIGNFDSDVSSIAEEFIDCLTLSINSYKIHSLYVKLLIMNYKIHFRLNSSII